MASSSSRPAAVTRGESTLSTTSSAPAPTTAQGVPNETTVAPEPDSPKTSTDPPSSSPSTSAALPYPRTQAEPPRIHRLNTADANSINAAIKKKSRRKPSFAQFLLGGGSKPPDHSKRPVRGGREPTEEENADLGDSVTSGSDVPIRSDTPIQVTRDELRRMNIEIGPQRSREEQRGKDRGSQWAWDIMYENQIGIYMFGRPFYSSRLLLPGGPTPFTLTASADTPRSTLTVSGRMGTNQPVPVYIGTAESSKPGQILSKAQWKQSQYLTAYTLDDKPLPNPEWEEVTPWMVNMKEGTDENGWRYNYSFRSRGWKSHAGTLGWGGWARRREWLKLIRFAPNDGEKSEPSPTDPKAAPWASKGEDQEKGREGEAENRLKKICKHSSPEENLHALLKVLGKVPLDRRKLELWDQWFSNAKPEEREKLDQVLQLPDVLDDLRFAFTFSASFTDFLALLQKHGVVFTLPETHDQQLPSGPPAQPTRPYTLTGP